MILFFFVLCKLTGYIEVVLLINIRKSNYNKIRSNN